MKKVSQNLERITKMKDIVDSLIFIPTQNQKITVKIQ